MRAQFPVDNPDLQSFHAISDRVITAAFDVLQDKKQGK